MRFLFDFFVFLFAIFLSAGVVAAFVFLEPSFLFMANWDIHVRGGVTVVGGATAICLALCGGRKADEIPSPGLYLKDTYSAWNRGRLLGKGKPRVPKQKTLDDPMHMPCYESRFV